MFLRQSTSQVIRFGPFLDDTDGVTPETALTIAQADMQLSKDGGAFTQKNSAGNATHDTDGWYSTTLDATDTATNAELIMQVNVAGSLPVWVKYYVVPVATYDALTTNGINNVAATDIVSGGAITTASGKVSNVATVDTTTTNTDMRGTDSANTVAPDNATIADTNSKVTALDISDLPTSAEFNARTLPSADYFVIGDYTAPDNATIQDTNTKVTAIDVSSLATTTQLNARTLLSAEYSTLVATDIVTAGAITTNAGIVSSDIKKINNVTINGDGSVSPFDV